jgi:hypothetical protein
MITNTNSNINIVNATFLSGAPTQRYGSASRFSGQEPSRSNLAGDISCLSEESQSAPIAGSALCGNLWSAFAPVNINFNFGSGSLGGPGGSTPGGSSDYVRGIEDSLAQIRGAKSLPDQQRVEALLKGAKGAQNSANQGGHRFSQSSSPAFGNRPPNHHCQSFLGFRPGSGATRRAAAATSPSAGEGKSPEYIRGVQAALAEIRGKDSEPDQKRVEALLK